MSSYSKYGKAKNLTFVDRISYTLVSRLWPVGK